MIYALLKSVFTPLEVINTDHFRGRMQASAASVLLTAVFGSVIAPLVYYYTNNSRYDISLNAGGMVLGVCLTIITWLAVCAMFWLLSKAFKKEIKFGRVVSTWGLSYIPNLLCIILYSLLLNIPAIYNTSGFLTFIFSTLFIILLVWKAIYYFMFLRFVIDTTLGEFLIITAVSAIVFAALILLGSTAGLQVPVV